MEESLHHQGCIKTFRTNGINYQPQLVRRISSINSISSINMHKSILYDMCLCIFWVISNITCLDITSTNWTPSPLALNGRITCHLLASMKVTHDMQSTFTLAFNVKTLRQARRSLLKKTNEITLIPMEFLQAIYIYYNLQYIYIHIISHQFSGVTINTSPFQQLFRWAFGFSWSVNGHGHPVLAVSFLGWPIFRGEPLVSGKRYRLIVESYPTTSIYQFLLTNYTNY